jgi:hypothetical protein
MAIHQIRPTTDQPLDDDKLRQVLLEAVELCDRRGEGHMQTRVILKEVVEQLSPTQRQQYQQALLTLYYDLFRTGHLAWGVNLSNTDPPHCHVTARGREMLKHLSRDPANPAGYLAHLDQQVKLDPVALSYLTEALNTYNSGCHKASAVMVGAAAESLVLGLRDVLVQRLDVAGVTLPAKLKGRLEDWRAKTVHDAVSEALDGHCPKLPRELREPFESYWPALAREIRASRNEAGQPSSIDPITPERSRAALLVFPLLAKLVADLSTWVQASVK